jgi:UDP-glucose 4-epimerase
VESLVRHGHDVLALGRGVIKSAKISTIVGNLTYPDTYADRMAEFNPDATIHLAWEGLPDYGLAVCKRNFDATILLYENVLRSGCRRMFVAGTCWEYGSATGRVTEDYVGKDLSLFAAYKASLYLIGKSMFDSHNGDLLWGRIFFAYGHQQRESSLIPSCFRALLNNVQPALKSPSAVNDFIHVADVAEAIRITVQSDLKGCQINIGSGQPTTVAKVVELVAKSLRKDSLALEPKEQTPVGFWADIKKLQSLNWKPRHSLDSGVLSTVNQFKR